MRNLLIAGLLMGAASARASAPQGAPSVGFAVANGAAAFAVLSDVSGDMVLRRLALDGQVLWEDHWGQGQTETPVSAAVTQWGGVSVLGEDALGCFVSHWSARGARLWATVLQYGQECHARMAVVDGHGNTYALATTSDRGVPAPTVWKIDRWGSIQWYYRPGQSDSRYGFALALDADGAGVTFTTAASGSSGWTYTETDLDESGSPRAPVQTTY